MILRDYQQDIVNQIHNSWSCGAKNVLAVLPTGAGKTVVASHIMQQAGIPTCAIAHRQELVVQISLSLARFGLLHRIIAPAKVVRLAISVHIRELGQSFIYEGSNVAVAGVDTLIRRKGPLASWCRSVGLVFMDEAHHVLRNNKWGRAVEMFPFAKLLGVTATAFRADGNGLGAHADGVFHSMCVGVRMAELIRKGALTPYRIYAPKSDMDLSGLQVGKTGDYNTQQLRKASQKSHIIGDVVEHYGRIARGRLGVTFTTDIETAGHIADRFNASGIPAAAISSKTPDHERISLVNKFARRELLQLVNVDIFGEGFDLPAIEVGSMARPTESQGLFDQQFGRALRRMDGKKEAIIIDHVGNCFRHGLPDGRRIHTLDRAERRTQNKTEVPLIKACQFCTQVYERFLKTCPHCGMAPEPAAREKPKQVDGDLLELTPEALESLRALVDDANKSPEARGAELQAKYAPRVGVLTGIKNQTIRLQQVDNLKTQMAYWAGAQPGLTLAEKYKKFYLTFGVDVLSAQGLHVREIEDLTERIKNNWEVQNELHGQ